MSNIENSKVDDFNQCSWAWGHRGAHDSEVLFSCPADKLDILMEGLETTHNAGLRYPIPAYMNYAPGFQESFESRAMERAGGTIAKAQD